MVEGTAKARLQRAWKTRTAPAGQSHDYKVGDLVDFHRVMGSKDASGWKGPAKIIDTTNISRGTVTVRYLRDLPIEARVQGVRQHMEHLVLWAHPGDAQEAACAEWAILRA